MRGEERKEGPLNKERGDGVGDSSLQSHSGANLNPKMAKNRGNVPKGGEADGVALTEGHMEEYLQEMYARGCLHQDTHMGTHTR
jgi:hypothetical protein